ncbi:MAG: glycosyltransferase, partial [Bacteroidales bacterium]|nr:glycosyltransferase [Bacteroidales bacterium]
MDISIIISLLNEEESLQPLTEWIGKVMQEHSYTYEIIMIDDGSKDKSWQEIERLSTIDNNIKGIKFRRN